MSSEHTTEQTATHNETQEEKQGWLRRQLKVALFIGLCAGALLYMLLHLAGKLDSMGQQGSNTAQIWSFIVAIIELGVSIAAIGIAIWTQKKEPKAKRRKISAKERRAEAVKYSPRYIIIGLAAALLAFIVPPVVNTWVFKHISTQNVTSQIKLTDNTQLEDGDWAKATLPTTKHTKMNITFRLVSEQETGSCVAPARMKITPSYSNSDGAVLYDVASGAEQTLILGDMNQPAKLTISLKNDPYCTVKLTVTKAEYFN